MLRKLVLSIISIAALVAYMILMDPYSNNTILDDIPYGIALMFLVKTFLIISVLITVNHLLLDYQLDSTYQVDEKELVRIASKDASAAASLMISRSLRYIANAIIIFGVLYFTADNSVQVVSSVAG